MNDVDADKLGRHWRAEGHTLLTLDIRNIGPASTTPNLAQMRPVIVGLTD